MLDLRSLPELLAGVDLDSLSPLLDRGLMRVYAPEDAGPLDELGIPAWFPQNDPETGNPLPPRERLAWAQTIFNEMYLEPPANPSPPARDLPPSAASQMPTFAPSLSANERSKKQRLASLNTLLLIRYEVENAFLPTPALL